MSNNKAYIWLEGTQWVIRTPYNKAYIEDLKRTFPFPIRQWDEERKLWSVYAPHTNGRQTVPDKLADMLDKHFGVWALYGSEAEADASNGRAYGHKRYGGNAKRSRKERARTRGEDAAERNERMLRKEIKSLEDMLDATRSEVIFLRDRLADAKGQSSMDWDRFHHRGGNSKTARRTLHVAEDAPTEVIAAAYKALARKYHPDSGGALIKMQEVNAAWNELK